jgi:hypothetical protein
MAREDQQPPQVADQQPAAPRNKGGRPATGHRALPAVRVPPELFEQLENRLKLLAEKSCLNSVSFYVRESLREKLHRDKLADRREARKNKPRRAK